MGRGGAKGQMTGTEEGWVEDGMYSEGLSRRVWAKKFGECECSVICGED